MPTLTATAEVPPAGALVTLRGLVSKPELNGRTGKVLAPTHSDEAAAGYAKGRVPVKLTGGGGTMLLKPEALELTADAKRPAPAALEPRDGSGSWDDIGEQQLFLALSESECASVRAGYARTSIQAAISYGISHGKLRAYGNSPRYDRLVLCTSNYGGGGMPGSATYSVEAELDAFDGLGGWRTTELTEADLKREGLLPLEASTLQAEFRGPLAFLEGLKVLGAPRYTMRTALDPSAKPHVIAVVERLIAASLLRFLLSEDALERADSA